jgi:hypothetical protein
MNSETCFGTESCRVASKVYRPGVMLWKVYSPAPLETVVFSTAVSKLRKTDGCPGDDSSAGIADRTAEGRVRYLGTRRSRRAAYQS